MLKVYLKENIVSPFLAVVCVLVGWLKWLRLM
jgi:hypothetical protein